MVLSELGEILDSFVDFLLLHLVSRDARRIHQSRIALKLGKTVLQGLNPTLYKKMP
jgi:hypothetical protein